MLVFIWLVSPDKVTGNQRIQPSNFGSVFLDSYFGMKEILMSGCSFAASLKFRAMETNYFKNLRSTFSESFSYGWETMKTDFLRLFLVILVCGIVYIPMSAIDADKQFQTAGGILLHIFGIAYFFLVRPVFSYSADLLFLQSVRRETIDVKNVIRAFDNYLNVILAHLLSMALIGLAFVALVIPGIIVACRLAFVPYLVMDKKLEAVAAVEESWRLTRGHGWTIFGMGITSFFIVLGGLILVFVGIFPALVWVNAAFASLYQAALNEKENAGNGNGEIILSESTV